MSEVGHWDGVYATRAVNEVSWYEGRPDVSAELIAAANEDRGAAIDIGGGASFMPEALLGLGFDDIASLDISAEAQRIARKRMGPEAARIRWIVADVTTWTPDRTYDVWHDRAALHFLTDPADQARYAATLGRALRPDGVAIIATFAPDGPERCSGLPVIRYDSATLSKILGPAFTLISERRHSHRTPGGIVQAFQFSSLRRA